MSNATEAQKRALLRRAIHDTKLVNRLASDLGYPKFKLKNHKLWLKARRSPTTDHT